MPVLGAHMSIAGGYYKAVERAHQFGCQCLQLFTKNNTQWRAKDISEDDVRLFRATLDDLAVAHPTAHSSYLINLAAADQVLWKKSIDGMVIELLRAELLGIPYLVVHPGAFVQGTESAGVRRCIRALNEIHRQLPQTCTQILLETTAGQGTSLGWRFEQLAMIMDRSRHPQRLGVCLDTCHIFAAGYGLTTQSDYQNTWKQFDQTIGLARLKAIHLNDSKRDRGTRVDRHAHIGHGKIGEAAFRMLLKDRRLQKLPMYLETPKGLHESGQDWDAVNLQTLRRLTASKSGQLREERSAQSKEQRVNQRL